MSDAQVFQLVDSSGLWNRFRAYPSIGAFSGGIYDERYRLSRDYVLLVQMAIPSKADGGIDPSNARVYRPAKIVREPLPEMRR